MQLYLMPLLIYKSCFLSMRVHLIIFERNKVDVEIMNIYDTKENTFSQIINCMINGTIMCAHLFLISLTAILTVVSNDVATSCC